MLKLVWEDCEPTIENFWENMATCDSIKNLESTLKIMHGYYKFEQNHGKTSKDLELDIREHGLNMGLIAADYTRESGLVEVIENKKMVICMGTSGG